VSSEELHEAESVLAIETIEKHRAITSLIEELQAVDWYAQRSDASGDGPLQAIIEHNRDEEKEHAAMLIEWLRRHDPVFDAHLRTYLFTDADIVGEERTAEGGGGDDAPSLLIGSLKGLS
jgi:ferritin-like protein